MSVSLANARCKPTLFANLGRWSYPDEILSAELLKRWSVCNLIDWKADSDSGDSERGPNGDDRGLCSPITYDQRPADIYQLNDIHLGFHSKGIDL